MGPESEAIRMIRAAYEAFNRGDFERAIADVHPDFELKPTESGPLGEPIRGREALLDYLKPDAFEHQQVTPLEFIESDDTVLVLIRGLVRGAGSGIELELEMFHVWRIRDGQLAGLEIYLDRDRAYEAAGLNP